MMKHDDGWDVRAFLYLYGEMAGAVNAEETELKIPLFAGRRRYEVPALFRDVCFRRAELRPVDYGALGFPVESGELTFEPAAPGDGFFRGGSAPEPYLNVPVPGSRADEEPATLYISFGKNFSGYVRAVHFSPGSSSAALRSFTEKAVLSGREFTAGGYGRGERPTPAEIYGAAVAVDRELTQPEIESLMPRRMKEKGQSVCVPCSRPGCGHTTIFPLGPLDPEEGVCAHEFSLDRARARMGAFVCRGCALEIPLEKVLDAGIRPEERYDRAGNALADQLGRLGDENTSLLVENARLRRELESEKRRRGGKR